MPTYCEVPDCFKNGKRVRSVYGYEFRKPIRCKGHKTEDMVNVMTRTCNYPGCVNKQGNPKQASFGYEKHRGLRCAVHKEADMINVAYMQCEEEGCITQASFGYTKNKPLRCSKHSLHGMYSVVSPKCQVENCVNKQGFPKIACYGVIKGKPTHCGLHKESHMHNVVAVLCNFNGCEAGNGIPKEARYGYEKGKPLRCKEHQEADMYSVRSRVCSVEECRNKYGKPTQASFGFEIGKPLRCKKHAEPGMIIVSCGACKEDGCNKRPLYGVADKTIYQKEYCRAHKLPDMVVIHSCPCDHCFRYALYGLPGTKATRCFEHKEEYMMHYPKRICECCRETALYSLSGPATHCETHKTANMVNRVERPCGSCGLPNILDSRGLCEYCDPEFVAEMQGRKEREIKELLHRCPDIPPFTSDRIIDHGSCGRERPDVLIDAVTHHVVVEVDEHQHRSYAPQCEMNRMFNIANHTLPTTFLRYNPDDYKPAKRVKRPLKHEREELLVKMVCSALKSPPKCAEDLCRVVYLFYDDFDHTKEPPVKRVKWNPSDPHKAMLYG